jgi:hypothetical protein
MFLGIVSLAGRGKLRAKPKAANPAVQLGLLLSGG